MKDDPRNVKKLLKQITSKTAEYDALKTNITMRVTGFGWEWCRHAWPKNGQQYTVKELSEHLEWIIRETKKRKLVVPTKPTPNVPTRVAMGILGTQTDDVYTLDKKYLEDEEAFAKKADGMRARREVTGDASMYSRMQPWIRP